MFLYKITPPTCCLLNLLEVILQIYRLRSNCLVSILDAIIKYCCPKTYDLPHCSKISQPYPLILAKERARHISSLSLFILSCKLELGIYFFRKLVEVLVHFFKPQLTYVFYPLKEARSSLHQTKPNLTLCLARLS